MFIEMILKGLSRRAHLAMLYFTKKEKMPSIELIMYLKHMGWILTDLHRLLLELEAFFSFSSTNYNEYRNYSIHLISVILHDKT